MLRQVFNEGICWGRVFSVYFSTNTAYISIHPVLRDAHSYVLVTSSQREEFGEIDLLCSRYCQPLGRDLHLHLNGWARSLVNIWHYLRHIAGLPWIYILV